MEKERNPQLIVIKSPYRNLLDKFNNSKSFPDAIVVIKGVKESLSLHRSVLGDASMTFCSAFNGENCSLVKCEMEPKIFALRVNWLFDTKNKPFYTSVFIKWLRFCYGEEQTFAVKECAAALAVLVQLNLSCLETARKCIVDFMINAATRDVNVGAKLLLSCVLDYEECHSESTGRVDLALARVLLTSANIAAHSDVLVDRCLVRLPPAFLDVVQYGDEASDVCEFNIRLKYVECQSKTRNISRDEMLHIMKEFKLVDLNQNQLTRLLELGAIDGKTLVKAFEEFVHQKEVLDRKVLDLEQQRDEEKRKADKITKDLETERGKTKNALKERDEEKRKTEKARKELEEGRVKLKNALKERDEEKRKAGKAIKELEEERQKLKNIVKERDEERSKTEKVKKELEEEKQKLLGVLKERDEQRREIEKIKKQRDEALQRAGKALKEQGRSEVASETVVKDKQLIDIGRIMKEFEEFKAEIKESQSNEEKKNSFLEKVKQLKRDTDNILSAILLAECYYEGIGVERNLEEANRLWKQVAVQSNAQQMFDEASRYAKGKSMNIKKSLDLCQRASVLGCADAVANMGVLYKNGDYLEKDLKKAAEMFQRASDMGCTIGMVNLGLFYMNGIAVEKDLKMAAELFQRASDLGHPSAANNLGLFYENGMGVPKDRKKAVDLFRRAAELGSPSAKISLVRCLLYDGDDDEKDGAYRR